MLIEKQANVTTTTPTVHSQAASDKALCATPKANCYSNRFPGAENIPSPACKQPNSRGDVLSTPKYIPPTPLEQRTNSTGGIPTTAQWQRPSTPASSRIPSPADAPSSATRTQGAVPNKLEMDCTIRAPLTADSFSQLIIDDDEDEVFFGVVRENEKHRSAALQKRRRTMILVLPVC